MRYAKEPDRFGQALRLSKSKSLSLRGPEGTVAILKKYLKYLKSKDYSTVLDKIPTSLRSLE